MISYSYIFLNSELELMYSTDIENSIPLISNDGIPVPIRDTRKPIEKHLAVYFILVSTLLERIAFYSLAANLVLSLNSNQVFNWKEANASIATLIFTGKRSISFLFFSLKIFFLERNKLYIYNNICNY